MTQLDLFKQRGCPNCGASDESATTEVMRASNPAETASFEAVRDCFIGFRKSQMFFTYSRCVDCGLCYSRRFFTNQQLSELYGSMPDNTAGEDRNNLSSTQEGYVENFLKVSEVTGRWLDLGADIGLLSSHLLRLGADSVDAIEPNVDVHQELAKQLLSRGRVGLNWEDFRNDKFDGVSAIHVLDHLEELSDGLREIRDHLAPNGFLLAVVHNERSLLRRILRAKWPPFCLQHPHLFSEQTLSATLTRHGFNVLEVGRAKNYFSLKHVFSMGVQVLGLPSSLARLVPNFVIPLKLGNIYVVASRSEGVSLR